MVPNLPADGASGRVARRLPKCSPWHSLPHSSRSSAARSVASSRWRSAGPRSSSSAASRRASSCCWRGWRSARSCGSITLVGVLLPDVGAWLIAFVPAPDFIAEDWIRLAMLILAIVLPLAVGAGGLMLMDADDRPSGIGGKAVQVLRGYPYAAVLSLVILFLLVVAPVFKLRTIIKRWDDAHIPIVIKPDGYEQRGRRPGGGRRRRRAGAGPCPCAAGPRGTVTAARGGRRRQRSAPGAGPDRDAARPRPRGDDPPVGRRGRRVEGGGRARPCRRRQSAHEDGGLPDRQRGGAGDRGCPPRPA